MVSFGKIFKAGVPCNVNYPEFHKTILFVMVASGFWSLVLNKSLLHKWRRHVSRNLVVRSTELYT